MRDDICTIPVSEVFEESDGCPICRMYETVEDRIITYILGDAMMEPDVRIETNKVGFCEKHLDKMMGYRGRLQLALMLETHLKSVKGDIFDKKLLNPPAKKAEKAKSISESCFICNKIEWGVSRMVDTIYRLYEKESDFRRLFDNQPQFCLKHYEQLVAGAQKSKMPHYHSEFLKSITKITGDYAESLCADISKYCSMYDYRNAGKGADWGNSKDAVERAVSFLSGKSVEK